MNKNNTSSRLTEPVRKCNVTDTFSNNKLSKDTLRISFTKFTKLHGIVPFEASFYNERAGSDAALTLNCWISYFSFYDINTNSSRLHLRAISNFNNYYIEEVPGEHHYDVSSDFDADHFPSTVKIANNSVVMLMIDGLLDDNIFVLHNHSFMMSYQDFVANKFEQRVSFSCFPSEINDNIWSFLFCFNDKCRMLELMMKPTIGYYASSRHLTHLRYVFRNRLSTLLHSKIVFSSLISQRYNELRLLKSNVKVRALWLDHLLNKVDPTSSGVGQALESMFDSKGMIQHLINTSKHSLSDSSILLDSLMDLMPLVYHLYNAKRVTDYVIPIFSFIRGRYKSGVIEIFSYVINKHLPRYMATSKGISNDSLETFFLMLENLSKEISDVDMSPLKGNLVKLLSCLFAHQFISPEKAKTINWLGLIDDKLVVQWQDAKGIPEITADLLNGVTAILRTVFSRPKGEHIFTISSCADLVSCIQWLIQYEYHRSPEGVESSSEVPDEVWIKNLEEAWKRSEQVYVPLHARLSVSRLKSRLIEMKMKAQSLDYGQRVLPFNVALVSGPGTGKSTWIVPALAKTALDGLGIRHSYTVETMPKGIANVSGSDKYFSTYDPVRHPVVSLDELGSGKSEMQRDNNVMNDMVSLLGENDYFPPKADVSEKGKVAYKPFINVLSSNNVNFGINDYINNTDAFWRRIHIMFKIRVKSEYQVEGKIGTQIDPAKVSDGSVDCIEFLPMICTANGPVIPTETGSDSDWLNFSEARDLVYRRATKHRFLQSGINKTRALAQELENQACEHGLLACPDCSNNTKVSEILSKMGVSSAIEPRSAGTFNDELSHLEKLTYTLSGIVVLLIYFCYFAFIFVFKRTQIEKVKRDIKAAYGLLFKLESLLDRVEHIRSYLVEDTKSVLHIASLCALVGGMVIFYKTCTRNDPKEEEYYPYPPSLRRDRRKEEEDIFPTGVYGSPPPTNHEVSKNPYDDRDGYVIYGKKSSMPVDVWQRKLSSNFLSVNIYNDKGDCVGGCSLLGVCEQYAIGPWHTLRCMKEEGHYLTVRKATTNELKQRRYISELFKMRSHPSLVEYLENDIAVIRLPDYNAFINLLDCFPSDVNYSGSLTKISGELMKHSQNDLRTLYEPYEGRKSRVSYNIGGEIMSPIVYDGYATTPNVQGCCGAVLTAIRGPQKFIVGFLVAGISSKAIVDPKDSLRHMFGILHKDVLDQAIFKLNAGGIIISPFSSLPLSDNRFIKDEDLDEVSKYNHSVWTEPQDRGVTDFLGSLKVPRLKEKSAVEWYPNGKAILQSLPKGYQHNLIAPKFTSVIDNDGNYLSCQRHTLNQISKPVSNINLSHLELAIENLTEKFCKVSDFQHDQILDMDTCVSGADNNPFVKSMELTTGTGYGYKGKKIDYVVPIPDDHPHRSIASNGKMLNSEMKEKIIDMVKTYKSGYRIGIIMQLLKKDEPRDKDKVAKRAIRMFVGVTVCNYILTKMYYGMFMGIFCRNPILCETVGGINSHGAMWGQLYKELSKFKNVINGDFSKYDKLISVLMLLASFTVIKKVKKHYGKIISDEHDRILNGIASDISNPILLLDKDLLQQPGSLASGVLLTFVLNNIANSLYIRLAYLHTESHKYSSPEECIRTFEDNVVFFAGGDDNTYSVSDKVKDTFNFKNVRDYFSSIGIKYTPADKTDREYLYEDISNASIFKRRWAFDSEYNIWKAPLERPSIGKMLTICVRSKFVSKDQQQLQALNQAVSELAQFDRDEFNIVISILKTHFPNLEADYDAILAEQSNSEVTPWVPDYEIPFVENVTPLSCDENQSAACYDHS